MNIEFYISLIIQVLILAFFVGIYVATIRFTQQQIEKLEVTLKEDKQELKDEMKRYNSVLERMIIAEQSTKAAHHRLDTLEEMIK